MMEWVNRGVEKFRENFLLFVGVALATIVLFGILGFLFALTGAEAIAGRVMKALAAGLILLLLTLLLEVAIQLAYFAAALVKDFDELIKKVKERYLSFLGMTIAIAAIYGIVVVVAAVLAKVSLVLAAAVSIVLGIFLGIKLITAPGRVVLGESAIESVRNAWYTPLNDSLRVFLLYVLFGVVSLLLLTTLKAFGLLLHLIVVQPLLAASYMEAVKEVTGRG